MKDYKLTVGLEIHAELVTKTKMFCNSKNDADELCPNVNVCPVCMGYPGTLPVINKEAVRQVLRLGTAVEGVLADYTEFDRKNYFYPDIPKGYQISQYKHPLVKGGTLAGVALTRIHLEEDTAALIHADLNQRISADKNLRQSASLLDFNRAGVPLVELVTEPEIHDAETAAKFAREFQLLLVHLGIAHANMEKGEMRIEANVSVSQIDADKEDADSRGLLYEDLTYKIRGAIFSVYNKLGSGHKESVYQKALAEELSSLGISYEKEKNIAVEYKDAHVGSYQPDFVVDDKIILEIKALSFTGSIEEKQLWYYLRNSKYRLGFIINFGSSPVQIGRVIYDSIRAKTQINADYSQIAADNSNLSASISDPKNPRLSALGTKVEVKNLNSFKSVEKAIKYEYERQAATLERGEKVVQETRGWDEEKEETFSQRVKEESHDYRYFPDPDLPKLFIKDIPDFAPEVLRRTLPELPDQRRERYKRLGLKSADIDIYVRKPEWARLFEDAATILKTPVLIQLASNYIMSDLKVVIPAESLTEVIRMVSKGEISSRGAKDILKIIQTSGGDPRIIAEERNLIQESDRDVLRKIADEVMKESPVAPIEYLIGQGMMKSYGKANPEVLREIFEELKEE